MAPGKRFAKHCRIQGRRSPESLHNARHDLERRNLANSRALKLVSKFQASAKARLFHPLDGSEDTAMKESMAQNPAICRPLACNRSALAYPKCAPIDDPMMPRGPHGILP